MDEPGPPVRRVGLADDQAEVLQRTELTGHRRLPDPDVRGEFRGALAAEFIQPDQQTVRGGLQVGVDLAGHLALVGAGPAQQHGQLPLQGQEFPVHTTRRRVGFDSTSAVVSVFVHVSPYLEFPGPESFRQMQS
jgi:hypothetical protein